MTPYPVITTRSSRIVDILDNLQDVRIRISSKLNKALHELDIKIKSIQVFVERGNQNIFMLKFTKINKLSKFKTKYTKRRAVKVNIKNNAQNANKKC